MQAIDLKCLRGVFNGRAGSGLWSLVALPGPLSFANPVIPHHTPKSY